MRWSFLVEMAIKIWPLYFLYFIIAELLFFIRQKKKLSVGGGGCCCSSGCVSSNGEIVFWS